MNKKFPRTIVGGLSLPRMIIGTNWFLGYSHTSSAAGTVIRRHFSDKETFFPILKAYMEHGIDYIMGITKKNELLLNAIRYAEDKLGKKIHIINTPILNVDDSAQARKEAYEAIKACKDIGSDFCLPHHSCVEQLVNKNLAAIPRLPDYLSMIRDCGMIPGLSAHMPELVVYSDNNEYDVETYIQIFNCIGFLMQVEVESVARIINNAKKPVMTIKPFAAGRITPYIGLTFNWNAIRPQDMVTPGVFSEEEAIQNIEISYAVFEHRFPDLSRRESPAPNQAALG